MRDAECRWVQTQMAPTSGLTVSDTDRVRRRGSVERFPYPLVSHPPVSVTAVCLLLSRSACRRSSFILLVTVTVTAVRRRRHPPAYVHTACN